MTLSMDVWNSKVLYRNYFCMELVKFCMVLYGFLGLDLVP